MKAQNRYCTWSALGTVACAYVDAERVMISNARRKNGSTTTPAEATDTAEGPSYGPGIDDTMEVEEKNF
ncbi:hypothetical protein TNCV_4666531 [Trichonephila clavipes]|nr:hypothetical protein TNCV_4666531 [Trichonephila clavipes]